jgi:D-sedoheptulose 7-phosphate isomerase
MKHLAQDYYFEIEHLLGSIKVADMEGKEFDFYEGISSAAELIEMRATSGGKLIFIGNGASAAISSHQATDFWKNGRIKAMAFNDPAGLTCVSNDFGYEYVFEKPIGMFADSGDILIAISSSGRSKNILLGAETAKKKGVKVITLSGFDEDNPLRRLGNINFYVPSYLYGHVEILHLSICHCILDILIQKRTELPAESVSHVTVDSANPADQKVLRKKPSALMVKSIGGAKSTRTLPQQIVKEKSRS